MKKLLDKVNAFFERVPDTMRRYRWIIWGIFLLLTVIVVMGTGRIKADMSTESFFQKTDPVKRAYDRFRAAFGSDETVYVVYEAKDGDVFSEQSLTALKEIQEELLNYRLNLSPEESSPLDHVTEVKTLINVKYLETRDDTLITRDFIGENIPRNATDRQQLRQQALAQRDYPLLYFSKDSKYGGLLIKTDFNATLAETAEEASSTSGTSLDSEEEISLDEEVDFTEMPFQTGDEQEVLPTFRKTETAEYVQFDQAINEILSQKKYTDVFTFYPVGTPVQVAFSMNAMEEEMGLITGLLFGLLLTMLWLSFRSLTAVVWPMLIVILTLFWTFGLLGWSGVVMSAMMEIIIFLVLAVGIADAVHILSGYLFFRRQNQDHQTALRSVFKKSGLACFLTSVTTATGLLALTFVPITPIKTFGMFAALSVLLAFVLTIFLLPLMLDLWNPVSKKRAKRLAAATKPPRLQTMLQKVETLSTTYPKVLVGIFLVAAVVFVIGMLNIRVDTNSIEIFKESVPLRKAAELVDRVMGGAGNLEILVDTGMVNGMKDPQVLNGIDALQRILEEQYPQYIVKTFSLVNATKDSFQALNEGNPDMYAIPQEPRMLQQVLFLFNTANPKDRRQFVTDDYRKGRIGVNTRNFGSQIGLQMMAEVDGFIEETFAPLKAAYPDLKVSVTGQIPLNNTLASYISWSQIKSFGLTLLVISGLLLLVFGSKKVGVIAIIPNIFPMITIFGLMGYFDVPLEMHLLLVAPITIGIAVDDTIHFLTHYRLEMQQHGDIRTAILASIREAGQAIVFTSIILAVGFQSYVFSVSMGFVYFGIFSGIAMLTALLADLFLLPAMLMMFRCRFQTVLQKDGEKRQNRVTVQ